MLNFGQLSAAVRASLLGLSDMKKSTEENRIQGLVEPRNGKHPATKNAKFRATVQKFFKKNWRTLLGGFFLIDFGAMIGACIAFPLGVQVGQEKEPEPSEFEQELIREQLEKINGVRSGATGI